MLTDEQIKECIENAFSPLKCVAEIWDYEHRIRFKIFDARDNCILEMPELILGSVRDEAQLRMVLLAARERVEKRGITLSNDCLAIDGL